MEIRALSGAAELHAVEELQREVWRVSDREVVPALHLIPACAVGGILLGAFDGGELVAFVYGFPGFEGDERIIHSDMLAVRASHRDRGFARALKLAQRDAALARGIRRITWTFDPLQAKNAYLNFAILGATADRYLRDFYGATSSPLHRTGTDRLWVTWDLDGRRGQTGLSDLQIEIPRDVDALSDNEARDWRTRTRDAFERAFAGGYVVTGFERDQSRFRLAARE